MAENTGTGFTKSEREAMNARSRELAIEKRASAKRADGEKECLKAIEAMEGTDREWATRLHQLVAKNAPQLWAKTWYGMPAYAKDGKVVCFFQPAQKFEARYATFGFNDHATLDEGNLWPTSFAIVRLTEREEQFLGDLIRKAVSA